MAKQVQEKSFFGNFDPKFQLPPENGKIEVVPFLNAAKQMPPFVDFFGMAFKPIKSDLQGNLDKLQKVLEKHSIQDFKTFDDILEYEKENGLNQDDKSATIALLWLKRGLNYIVLLLEYLVEDHHKGIKEENIVSLFTKAYETSLKMYHKWLIQKIFSVMMRTCPYRKDLYKAIANGADKSEDEIILDIEDFLSVMRPNVDALCNMYTQLDVDYQYKV